MPPSESPAKDKTKRTPSSKAAVDDPTFTSGDFQVVTADNVRFLVASEVLLAARCAPVSPLTPARSGKTRGA